MKGTRHNGRSGKDGVYNPKHNDRRFDPEHSEHIEAERVRKNIYWDCYQGYTTQEDREKETVFSFDEIERAYYTEKYGEYVMAQNDRHRKARHPDRCKTVEDVLRNKKTCPEESIYQLGTMEEHASAEMLVRVFDEFKKEFEERFGSNVHIIDWSLHMDEATPHIHERHVFDAANQYGEIEPKQEAALKELGFELPDPEKTRSKTNNRKVVFDSACRAMFLDICRRYGLDLDEEPAYGGRSYLEKQDYIRMKQKEKIIEQKKEIMDYEKVISAKAYELLGQKVEYRENMIEIIDQKKLLEKQSKEWDLYSRDIARQYRELTSVEQQIEDVEAFIHDVSNEIYDKVVEEVTNEVTIATRKDDIWLVEDSKAWIQQRERKGSKKEKNYALARLDGVIRKIEKAMQTRVERIKQRLFQPEKKREVVRAVQNELKPSVMKRLAEKKEQIAKREAEVQKNTKTQHRSYGEDR